MIRLLTGKNIVCIDGCVPAARGLSFSLHHSFHIHTRLSMQGTRRLSLSRDAPLFDRDGAACETLAAGVGAVPGRLAWDCSVRTQ